MIPSSQPQQYQVNEILEHFGPYPDVPRLVEVHNSVICGRTPALEMPRLRKPNTCNRSGLFFVSHCCHFQQLVWAVNLVSHNYCKESFIEKVFIRKQQRSFLGWNRRVPGWTDSMPLSKRKNNCHLWIHHIYLYIYITVYIIIIIIYIYPFLSSIYTWASHYIRTVLLPCSSTLKISPGERHELRRWHLWSRGRAGWSHAGANGSIWSETNLRISTFWSFWKFCRSSDFSVLDGDVQCSQTDGIFFSDGKCRVQSGQIRRGHRNLDLGFSRSMGLWLVKKGAISKMRTYTLW